MATNLDNRPSRAASWRVRAVGQSLVIFLLCQFAPFLQAQEVPGCGVLDNAYGPFDYRDPVAKRDMLPIVDAYHFTSEVESLVRGKSGTILGDISYTLRAFPNHHRALKAVAQYALRGNRFPEDAQIASADCYFRRAIAFRPDDESVRVIYGNYLFKRGQREDALQQYQEALRIAPASMEINYVTGLFFLESGDLARAKHHAKVAYESGYPLPGLRDKIAAAEAARAKPQ